MCDGSCSFSGISDSFNVMVPRAMTSSYLPANRALVKLNQILQKNVIAIRSVGIVIAQLSRLRVFADKFKR